MPTEFSEGVAGRYSAEKLKLKAQQALRLKTAMAKLVGNYDHSDIILESSDGRQLPSHLCILKSRAPGFYKCYVEPFCSGGDPQFPVGADESMISSESEENRLSSSQQHLPTSKPRATPVVRINDVDYNSLKFFLRCIYTAEEVPSHPTMCSDAILTTSSMSSSGYDPARDNNDDDNDSTNHRVLTASTYATPPSEQYPHENQSGQQHAQQPLDQSQSTTMTGSSGSARLATSVDSHGSGRTYTLEEQESAEQTTCSLTSSHQSTPARRARIYASPERGTRALTVSAYSPTSVVASEPLTKCYSVPLNTSGSPTLVDATDTTVTIAENSEMMTSFAELAAASTSVAGKDSDGDGGSTAPKVGGTVSDSPGSLALTTSMESATSDDQNDRGFGSTYVRGDFVGRKGGTFPRSHRADHMIGKFIRVDGASSSSEQSPQQQQPPPADKKIFPMFFEMDNTRPSRLSLCDSDVVPLSVAAAGAVRRSGSGCTIDSPARSQMGRKRWSVTSLRSIDSADLASPLSSHDSVITGLDEEQTDNGAEDGALQGACSRLGKDLVSMLMEGKDTDLTILTNGGQLKAHRCILAMSCPYFKAMLNGDWLENRNSVIELNGFSENTIMCALRLIYGGVVDVPENVSVWELISFADMIQLDDLKQVAYLHIRGKYCHFFHKPCSGCVNGVLECLPYLHSFGVSELLDRCRQWQAKYFARIWKTKLFNLLSEELLEMCYRSVVDSMTPVNILDIMLGCEKLQLTLPKSKSAEAAGALVACLTDAALEYLSTHLDKIIESPGFTTLGKGYALNLSLFEDVLPSVVHSLSPDAGCRSLVKIYELMTLIASQQQTGEEDWNDRFVNLLRRLYELCDTHLIHYASAVVRCESWTLLTPDMQRRIQETGIFVDIRQPKAPPPRLSSFNKTFKRSSASADRVRDRSVSIHRYRPPPPLTECPSKSVVSDTSTKSTPSPQTSVSSQAKASMSERKKDRRQSPSKSGSSGAKKPSAPPPPSAVEKEKEAAVAMTRSSTTDLTPGEAANPKTPVIDAWESKESSTSVQNVEAKATTTAESVETKPADALAGVENVIDVGACGASDQEKGKADSARLREETASGTTHTLDENKAPTKGHAVTTEPAGLKTATSAPQSRPPQKTKVPHAVADGASTKKTAEQKPTPASALKQPQVVSASKASQLKKAAHHQYGEEAGGGMHRSHEMTNLKAATEATGSETKAGEVREEEKRVEAVEQTIQAKMSTKADQSTKGPVTTASVDRSLNGPVTPAGVQQAAKVQAQPMMPEAVKSKKLEQKHEQPKSTIPEPKVEPKDSHGQEVQESTSKKTDIEDSAVDAMEEDRPRCEAPVETPTVTAPSITPDEKTEAVPSTPEAANGHERMEMDENTPSDQGSTKAIRERTSSAAADRSRAGVKTGLATVAVTPSVSPKKPVGSKPTAKVAGIPKTTTPSTSTATPPAPQQRQVRGGGSNGTSSASTRTPRASHATAGAASKSRATAATHSPMRKAKTTHSSAKK